MHLAIRRCLLAALLAPAVASHAATVHLRDGSVVRGDISGLENGVYEIRSDTLGLIEIDKADIETIEFTNDDVRGRAPSPGAAAPGARSSGGRADTDRPAAGQSTTEPSTTGRAVLGQVQSIQQRLANDPATMAAIERLGSDPQIRAVLSDPAVMRAISSGDLAALLSSEAFRQLMSNPSVQAIVGEVKGR